MEIVWNILQHIRIGDLYTRIWFGIVDSMAVNELIGTTYTDILIKGIFPMEQQVMPIHSRAVAILAFNPTPPPILASVRNDLECTATEEAKEPSKPQINVQADYTFRTVEAKTIPQQPIMPIRVRDAFGGLVAVEQMPEFGEGRCFVLVRWLIDVTLRSPFKITVTNFSNQPVLLHKPMPAALIAEQPACVVHIRDQNITAEEEACDVAEVSVPDQTGSVKEEKTKTRMMILRNKISEKRLNPQTIQQPLQGILSNDD